VGEEDACVILLSTKLDREGERGGARTKLRARPGNHGASLCLTNSARLVTFD